MEEIPEAKEAMQVRPLQRHPWMALSGAWEDLVVMPVDLVAGHPSVEPKEDLVVMPVGQEAEHPSVEPKEGLGVKPVGREAEHPSVEPMEDLVVMPVDQGAEHPSVEPMEDLVVMRVGQGAEHPSAETKVGPAAGHPSVEPKEGPMGKMGGGLEEVQVVHLAEPQKHRVVEQMRVDSEMRLVDPVVKRVDQGVGCPSGV